MDEIITFKLVYHPIVDDVYIGIVTILDYEIDLRQSLSIITFDKKETKVIIDCALKTGINKYRFVAYDIAKDGNIQWETNMYVSLNKNIEILANQFLKEKQEILSNSILTSTQKFDLL